MFGNKLVGTWFWPSYIVNVSLKYFKDAWLYGKNVTVHYQIYMYYWN